MKFVRYVVVVALGCALAGCTPGTDVSPAPTWSPPASTPTSPPTPQWSPEEQAAIDAVQRYLEVWAAIGQDLVGADWNKIWDVATDPAAGNAMDLWTNWSYKGWHLVGAPAFTPSYLTPGARDVQGEWWHVYGCYVIEGSYVADASGTSVGDEGRRERGMSSFDVLHATDGAYVVATTRMEAETC